jgi:UDP-N-acetylglucosamine--N-acetylmuramyl-(pentapeptide) pyrophosphoryl-undecaprenol N-acetylglucosamine transferase
MKIWIATGGTGGHVCPALAVGNALARLGHRVTISTDKRGMKMVRDGIRGDIGIAFVWADQVGARSKLRAALSLIRIGLSSIAYFFRFLIFRPDRVVAFGGYSSVPVVFAAYLLKIPTLLHEQNAVIGRANKLSLRWVNTLMTSFPDVQGIPKNIINIEYTGLPVRSEFADIFEKPKDPDQFRILVTGGSLGATILDQTVPTAIAALPSVCKKKVFIVHQTRPELVKPVDKAYRDAGIRANVLSFINDMANQISSADLAISRAGASTIAEFQATGTPAITVPLEINPDQPANAVAFEKQGGGIVAKSKIFTPKWLAATLEELISNPARVQKMAQKAKLPNNAAERIAEIVVRKS